MKLLSLLFSTLLLAGTAAAEEPVMKEQLRLWEGPAPHAPENPGPEVREAGGRVSHVSIPTLDVYLPDPARATGRALLICSGGGYRRLASEPLGRDAARIFLPRGIAVFSLKYRLRPPSGDVRRDAVDDGRRAMRIIRSRAAQWRVDPNAVGMVGFSAGSNLILNLVCAPAAGDPTSADPVERQSARPDFIVLCAAWPDGQKIGALAISPTVPPAYLLHARDDKTAPFSFAEEIAAAWKKNGVPVHLEPYATGGHIAFNFPAIHAADWPEKFLAWLDGMPPNRAKKPGGASSPLGNR